jgi:hypothetical protein
VLVARRRTSSIWNGSRLFATKCGANGRSWRTSWRHFARLNEINRASFNQQIDVRYDCVIGERSIFANLILVVPGPARTVGTTFRATFSSAARSCTTATMFTLNAKSLMRAPLLHSSAVRHCSCQRPVPRINEKIPDPRRFFSATARDQRSAWK